MSNGMPRIGNVKVISTGQVWIRPQHAERDRTPILWWLLTSRRWTRSLPINVYVIEHEGGLVLFDTGQDRRSVTDADYFPGGIAGLLYRRLAKFTIGEHDTVTAGLERLGYSADQVHTAIVSHLHQDHMGGIRELQNARIVVSAAEWRELDSPLAQVEGFLVEHIRIPGLKWHQVTPEPSEDAAIAPFDSAHDVFGDGSLLLLPTPGHTAGSLSLLVNRDAGPPLLLVGDLTYDVELLAAGRIPGMGRRSGVRRSTELVRELQRRRPGLTVLAAHDPAASALLDAAMAVTS
jgi:glyoxylase-like metal-dependent hydrolase (beta-lactamase superfamily II)